MQTLSDFEKWLDAFYSANPYYDEIKAALKRYYTLLDNYHGKRISNVMLITNDGRMITSALGSDTLDLDIFSAMLTAINNFVQDTLKGSDSDSTAMSYGNYNIQIERGKDCFIAVLLNGPYTLEIRNRSQRIMVEIEKRYCTVLSNWDGNTSYFTGLDVYINKYLVEYTQSMQQNTPAKNVSWEKT